MKAPLSIVLGDKNAERVRRDHARAISELQQTVTDNLTTGRYLGRQVFSSNGLYTPTAGCKTARGRAVAGGGGGGGAAGGTSTYAAGGGGSSGAYIEFYISSTSPIRGGAVVIGAGGVGGAGSADGSAGGDTVITINGLTLTAKGGLGGSHGTSSSGTVLRVGGAVNSGTSTAVDIASQSAGEGGVVVYPSYAVSGAGGSSPVGAGGGSTFVAGNGNAGQGHGGGGGGAVATTTNMTGGDGTKGLLIVDEWG